MSLADIPDFDTEDRIKVAFYDQQDHELSFEYIRLFPKLMAYFGKKDSPTPLGKGFYYGLIDGCNVT